MEICHEERGKQTNKQTNKQTRKGLLVRRIAQASSLLQGVMHRARCTQVVLEAVAGLVGVGEASVEGSCPVAPDLLLHRLRHLQLLLRTPTGNRQVHEHFVRNKLKRFASFDG